MGEVGTGRRTSLDTGALAWEPAHVEGFQGTELFSGRTTWLSAFLGDPSAQREEGALLGAGALVGNIEVLVCAPESAGCSQTASKGPFGCASGAAQHEGEGVGDGEGAEKVVLGVAESREIGDLLVEPAGEGAVVGVGTQVAGRAGEPWPKGRRAGQTLLRLSMLSCRRCFVWRVMASMRVARSGWLASRCGPVAVRGPTKAAASLSARA